MSAIQTQIPAGTWNLDPIHSTAGFEVAYLAGTFRGTFRDVQAELDVSDGRARIQGTAYVASVDVKDENLAAHLQSPDFFDAERHPELRFVAGDVDLESETVDASGDERIGLRLSATVDRTEFGLNWNMPLPTGDQALANTVMILTELQLVKA